jgi:hypothetical protein
MKFLRLCLLALSCIAGPSLADTTINDTNKYAYGANIGWLNWQADTNNGASLGHYFCTGFVYSANVGWISLGHGPTNRCEYSNASKDDYGVNITDGGLLRGFAYGANIGWIGLNNAQAFVQTDSLAPGPNADADGLPDDWELKYASDLGTIGGGTNDSDGDGMLDVDEYAADTDPLDPGEFLAITAIANDGGTNAVLTWSITKNTRLYSLDTADALSNSTAWIDSGLGVFPPDAGTDTTRITDVPGVTNRFFRAVSHVPLSP